MNVRSLTRGALAAALLFSTVRPVWSDPVIQTGVEVLPFNAAWEALLLLDGSSTQMDPVALDPDFLQTWNTAAYDGPAFLPAAPAPLFYGILDFIQTPQGTSLPPPATGSRGAVYLRTAIDLTGELSNIIMQALVDDGIILYVDGVRWCSVNMTTGATSTFSSLAPAIGNESALVTISAADDSSPLPVLAPGRHTLHVSLHNNNFGSSDIGFMLRITGDLSSLPPVPNPALVATASPPSTDGSPRILLSATGLDPAETYLVQSSPDLTTWLPVGTFPASVDRTQFTVDVPASAGRKYYRLAK